MVCIVKPRHRSLGMLVIVYVQCDNAVVQDLQQILAVPSVFLPVSLGIFHYVPDAESSSVSTINNKFCGLDFILRVVFAIGRIDVLGQLFN